MNWSIRLARAWVVLLVFVLLPLLAPDPGQALIRGSIRLALGYYALAVTFLLLATAADWRMHATKVALARTCWTLACVTYLLHVALAFHYFHHWSHADAVRHTEAVSGFGPGIYVSHCFGIAWTADVVAWWLWPAWYAGRSPWLGRALHSFLAFVIFNGTVVFESGFVRWAGVALGVWLGGVACFGVRNRKRLPAALA